MPNTFTSTGYANPVRAPQTGSFLVSQTFTHNGTSASVSDVVFMFQLQADTYVYGGWVTGVTGGAADTWKVGTTATDNLLSSAVTIVNSAATPLAAAFPIQVTKSADAEGLLTVPIIATRSAGTSTATSLVTVTLLCQRRGAV